MKTEGNIPNFRTLFLDRDGVINQRLPGAYVRTWEEFTFLPQVPAAIAGLHQLFNCIVIVTNQQGVGKGLMTQTELDELHERMCKELDKEGAMIHGVYACTELADQVPSCRKPHPAMALAAKEAIPRIQFQQSIMVGDSISDIDFGLNLGMKTIWIAGKEEEYDLFQQRLETDPDFRIDGSFPSLWEFYRNATHFVK